MSWLKTTRNWFWETFKVAWPLWGAAIVTAGFALWVYLLANEVTVQEPYIATRWEHFLHGRPNELGDALAGFVGSLTLIWVVASVIQQSMELRAQRNEFQKMVDAQDAQVKALKAQAEIFEDEMNSRERQRKMGILKAMVHNLKLYMISDFRRKFVWEFNFAQESLPTRKVKFFPDESYDDLISKLPIDDAVFFARLPRGLNRAVREVVSFMEDSERNTYPSARHLEELTEKISEIVEYAEFCAEGRLYIIGCQMGAFQKWVDEKMRFLPFDEKMEADPNDE